MTVDGSPTPALMLAAPEGRWAAVVRHADLMLTIAARDVAPGSVRLEPIANPAAHLLGPEPPDA